MESLAESHIARWSVFLNFSDFMISSENDSFDPPLACPCVFNTTLDLHPRLTTAMALKVISVSLEPFSITNRTSMFVSVRNKTIYYWKILESIGLPNHALDLIIFGIETTKDPKAYAEIVLLVESKLNIATQNFLGDILSRNPNAKVILFSFLVKQGRCRLYSARYQI